MNPLKHYILGVFFLLTAIYFGYEFFESAIRIEHYPSHYYDQESLQNVEPEILYVNPLTTIFIGSIEIDEHRSYTITTIQKIFILLNLLFFGIFLWHSIAQFRMRKISAFIRILAVIPFISRFLIILALLQYTIMKTSYNLLDSILWLLIVILGAVGLIIAYTFLKPAESSTISDTNQQEASIGIRFVHQIIDRSFLIIAFFLTTLFFILYVSFESSVESLASNETAEIIKDLLLLILGIIIIISIGIFESVSHWSPAKLLTGYKVVATSDQPLGVGRVMLRTLCRIIPFDAWSFLFRKNWHDRISGTTLSYTSELPWFTKQAKWMYKMALAFMIICCLGFSAFVLDLMCEEDVIRLFNSRWGDDVFDFYWQIALAAIFLFIPIQAGFSAAIMNYSEYFWDTDSEDRPGFLLTSLFAWFPVLGWMVCSRPTSDVEDAFGHKNSEHPDYDSFVSRGRGVRRSLRFYHIMSILIVIVLLTSRFNKITLITIAMLFLFTFVFVSTSWFRYAKRLTQSQELANIEN